MAFEVRLDPDDGTPPAVLDYEEYQALFPTLVAVSPSFLAPLKRFRGPHARFDVAADAIAALLREITALRTAAPSSAFLVALDTLARQARAQGAGLTGRSP
ncbi:MAG TPA: hypothetical protein VM286_10085 [Candidatus Thermoplasmatota archaeon]|nr:hypothetical protein [Candidatus Thermoplasmatota archaeon]